MTSSTELNTELNAQGNNSLVFLGYLTAVLLPIVGFVLGVVILTRPAVDVAKHGVRIIVVSIVAFVMWAVIFAAINNHAVTQAQQQSNQITQQYQDAQAAANQAAADQWAAANPCATYWQIGC